MWYPDLTYTDHYQLSMAIAAWRDDREFKEGTMEFFCRSMPPTRRYLVFAGLHRVVELLMHASFDDEMVRYLKQHETLGPVVAQWPGFLKWAKEQKFEDITLSAMQEGEIFFPNEPVLRITGKIPLLQLIETPILSILNHDINVASKAARIADAAEGRRLFEFGMRRTGLFDSPFAASAAMAAGFHGTSNVAAGWHLELPTLGTMAHSIVQSYGPSHEFLCFCKFLTTYRQGATLLVDTYDIQVGTLNAIAASRATKVPLVGVRLDSGDPKETVPLVRGLLDHHGFASTDIIVSNDMDEYKISALPKSVLGKIAAFGVGTQVVNPSDCTSLGFVGKLVEIGTYNTSEDSIKLAADPAKTTSPGKKQVLRKYKLDAESKMYLMAGDTIGLDSEYYASAGYGSNFYTNKSELDVSKEQKKDEGSVRLLDTVHFKSKPDIVSFSVSQVSQRFRKNQLMLPTSLRSLTPRQPGEDYPVEQSTQLQNRRDAAIKKVQDAVAAGRTRYKL